MLRIKLYSIFVDDQTKALRFYTEVLGFKKAREIPVGGGFRWLTVRSADEGDTELSLEPNVNPAARTYQQALLEQGIPATAFEVDDIAAEFERLKQLGVQFTGPPKQAGPVQIAIFSDSCGNLIQLYQPPSRG
jgi:catechol 2,3-dioxygenase-like lactoylglutathione lyase family enzyme